MRFYAIVDTNVIVSALLSKNDDSATVQVIERIFSGDVIPLYSNATMAEYREVLARKKFKFVPEIIEYFLSAIEKFRILVEPNQTSVDLPDPKDVPFYEIVLEKKDDFPYLVTGNIKHFTREPFVVTPAEFIAILNNRNPSPFT